MTVKFSTEWKNLQFPRHTDLIMGKVLDFIIIGAQKSGTTSLAEYLRPHPEIFLPEEKELPFFISQNASARAWDEFASIYFRDAASTCMWGKATTHYMIYPASPHLIRSTMPDIKLIAILREPVSRAFSQYQMEVRRRKETCSFEIAFEQQLKPDALARARRFGDSEETAEKDCYLAFGEYGRILKRYFATFRREQILVLFLDELSAEPAATMEKVQRFLGVKKITMPSNIGRRYHQGSRAGLFASAALAAKSIPLTKMLWKLLAPAKLKSAVRRRTGIYAGQTPMRTEPLSEEMRMRLTEFYRQDMADLKTLLERPLPWPQYNG